MAKIFLLMDDPRINTGYAATNRITIRNFKKLGHECLGFTFNGGEPEGDFEGTRIIEHPRNSNDQNESLYGSKNFILSEYYKHKPDILFFHNDFYRQSWFFELPQEIQEKSIWWLPLDMVREDKNLDFSFLNRIPNLYFVSESAAKYTKVKYNKIIPHAIDDIYFNQEKAEKINKNIFTICRVDRHQPRKQWPYAIHAYSIFSKGKKDSVFLAKCNPRDSHGFDPDTRQLIDLEWFSKEQNVRENITFFNGVQSSEEMIKNIFDQSDVFLTTTGSEGFGLGLVEAMSRGCVPIFPNGSSLPEIVENYGYRYNYGQIRTCPDIWAEYGRPDVMVVAEKIQTAYTDWKFDNDKFANLSKQCINKAKAYNPNRIYGIWDHEIKNILGNIKSTKTEYPIEVKDKNKGNIKYSIIIVSKDKTDMLKNCINSIISKTRQNYEIIIVENCGSEKSYMDILKYKRENIKIIRNEIEGGFTYANNIGIKEATGDYIVLLNNDTIIESEDWLEIPRMQMEEKEANLIGPSRCWFSLTSNKNDLPKKLIEQSYFNKDIESYCCTFTGFWFVMAKKEQFEKYPLNEKIKFYIADDVDYCLRMNLRNEKWTVLEGIHNDGKGLIKHLQEQSRDILDSGYKDKGVKEFFDCWKDNDLKEKITDEDLEKNIKITITIPTRNREIHLNRLLTSIYCQTYNNWDLIICNDGDNFSKETKNIIDFISMGSHNVKILSGLKKGPAYSHDLMMREAKTEWIFRIDDDNILERDCLENLVEGLNKVDIEKTAAIAPLVLSPFVKTSEITPPFVIIDDFMSAAYAQQNIWNTNESLIKAEHLHSSFLYNKKDALDIGGFIYSDEMESIVSFGEETIFTYKLFLSGKELYITNKAKTWHFISELGGTRDNDKYFNSRNKDYNIYLKTIENLKGKMK